MHHHLMRSAALTLACLGVLEGCGNSTVFPKCDDPSKPCPPVQPNYPPLSSAETLDACTHACENLRSARVNCPEGFGSVGGEPCAVTCVNASRLRPLPLACWMGAKSDVDARACGSLRCVR